VFVTIAAIVLRTYPRRFNTSHFKPTATLLQADFCKTFCERPFQPSKLAALIYFVRLDRETVPLDRQPKQT